MRILDLIRLAFLNLFRKKLRSMLTMCGVMIGCLLVIIIFSISAGFNRFIVEQINHYSDPRVLIVTHEEGFNGIKLMKAGMRSVGRLPRKIRPDEHFFELKVLRKPELEELRSVEHVESVKPFVFVPLNSIRLKGSEDRYEVFVAEWIEEEPLVAQYGGMFSSPSAMEIILSPEYAEVFGKHPDELIGKTVVVELGEPLKDALRLFPGFPFLSGKPKEIEYEMTISGFTPPRLFTTICWMPEETSRRLGRESLPFSKLYTDELLGLAAKVVVDSPENVAAARSELRKRKYLVMTQDEAVGAIRSLFDILEMIFSVFAFVALTVAAFGIINTLITSANERRREIAVMMAVGATRGVVRGLFALEGAAIGFWGALVASVIGNILGLITNLVVSANWPRIWSEHHIFAYQLWLVPVMLLGASLLGFLAGLYPAHRASRLNPVDVLRYN